MDRLKSQNLQPESRPVDLTKGSADTQNLQTQQTHSGEKIGKYEVINEIGRGGMSIVYKARDPELNRLVAIKLLISKSSNDNANLLRFQQEARAASQLEHVNIVKVHDFSTTDDGTPYLVMSYLSGMSLADAIKKEGNFSFKRWLSVMIQACDALEHAHLAGIVHRDIKPSNFVLADENGTEILKLVDFGIAKNSTDDMSLTKTGEVFGSPLYMSPEQCSGAKLDSRSDIYSLGCVMYEALAGRPPLSGANSLETFQKHLIDKPNSLTKLKLKTENIQQLDRIVMHCLEKKPEDRYQNLGELKEALEQLLTGEGAKKPSAISVPIIVMGLLLSLALFAVIMSFDKIGNHTRVAAITKPNDFGSPADTAASQSNSKLSELDKLRAEYATLVDRRNYFEALATAQKTAILADELHLPLLERANIHLLEARCEQRMQHPVAASEHYDEAMAILSDVKLPAELDAKYRALIEYGHNLMDITAYGRAGEIFRQATATGVQLGKPKYQAFSLKYQGLCAQEQKDRPRAVDYYEQSLKLNPGDPDLPQKIKKLKMRAETPKDHYF